MNFTVAKKKEEKKVSTFIALLLTAKVEHSTKQWNISTDTKLWVVIRDGFVPHHGQLINQYAVLYFIIANQSTQL